MAQKIPVRQAGAVEDNNGDLNEALDRIYERYGSDLPAFFRDAYNEAMKCEEAEEESYFK
ncbi:MAG TPA: hypothetical protein VLZ81_03555 [Blastocatellia bacterium]|nr:hypothetical protein [Blastocatellia bacterium]